MERVERLHMMASDCARPFILVAGALLFAVLRSQFSADRSDFGIQIMLDRNGQRTRAEIEYGLRILPSLL